MFRILFAASLVVASLSFSSPASAQAIDPDLRCVIVSKFFATAEKDPQKKQIATLSTFFFFGRADGRLSLAQITAQLGAPGASIKQTEVASLMNACAKRMQDSQRALVSTLLSVRGTQPAKKGKAQFDPS